MISSRKPCIGPIRPDAWICLTCRQHEEPVRKQAALLWTRLVGQVSRSFSLNRTTIRLQWSKNLTHAALPSLRPLFSDRLLGNTCHLLAVAIPGEIHATRGRYGPLVERFIDNGGGYKYGRDLTSYSMTSGGCSCDLVYPERFFDSSKDLEGSLRRKYKQKGRSESKINRAVADSNKRKASRGALRADVEELFSQYFKSSGEIQFILHWQNG